LPAKALSHLISPLSFIDSSTGQSDRALNYLGASERSPRGLITIVIMNAVLIFNMVVTVANTSSTGILTILCGRISVFLETSGH
jgi:hypothetical protein